MSAVDKKMVALFTVMCFGHAASIDSLTLLSDDAV